jgi:hypothetical protein
LEYVHESKTDVIDKIANHPFSTKHMMKDLDFLLIDQDRNMHVQIHYHLQNENTLDFSSKSILQFENMPIPLQVMSNIIPAKWYYIMIKNIMIKGTGLSVIWKSLLILTGMMMVLFTIAVKKFKIRLE